MPRSNLTKQQLGTGLFAVASGVASFCLGPAVGEVVLGLSINLASGVLQSYTDRACKDLDSTWLFVPGVQGAMERAFRNTLTSLKKSLQGKPEFSRQDRRIASGAIDEMLRTSASLFGPADLETVRTLLPDTHRVSTTTPTLALRSAVSTLLDLHIDRSEVALRDYLEQNLVNGLMLSFSQELKSDNETWSQVQLWMQQELVQTIADLRISGKKSALLLEELVEWKQSVERGMLHQYRDPRGEEALDQMVADMTRVLDGRFKETHELIRAEAQGIKDYTRQVADELKDLIRGVGADLTKKFDDFAQGFNTGTYSSFTGSEPARVRHNLPAPSKPIIGRETEVEEATHLLLSKRVRLLTLLGPGGSGKSRLALEIGLSLVEQFKDGVFLVELSPVADKGLVETSIARALGIRQDKQEAERTPAENLAEYLRDRQILLLLDNFEHLIERSPLVAYLLQAARGLKVLATSRERLNIDAEYQFDVEPLEIPPSDKRATLSEIGTYPSVELFVQRAQAANRHFRLNHDNAPSVAELCRRLDGLPLAIELAAARIKSYTPQRMLAELEQRWAFLTGSTRDVDERHLALHTTLKWSYDLLTPEEQGLFRSLSVFRGGCTPGAAIDMGLSHGLQQDKVEALLESLSNKSLLQIVPYGSDEFRLTMLETVREFGFAQLAASTGRRDVHYWHAAYFLQLGESAEPLLRGASATEWLDREEMELANFRAALDWLAAAGETEMLVRTTNALGWFWFLAGYYSEGTARFEQAAEAVDRSEDVSPSLKAKILDWLSLFLHATGSTDRALALAQKVVALHRESGSSVALADSILNLAVIESERSADVDYELTRALFQEAQALYVKYGEKLGLADTLYYQGYQEYEQRHLKKALQLYEHSLAIYREMGANLDVGDVLSLLADIAFEKKQWDRAESQFLESLSYRWEARDRYGISLSLDGLAAVAAVAKHPEQSARLSGAADAIRAELGTRIPEDELPEFTERLNLARSQLTEGQWNSFFKEGQMLSTKEAVEEAIRTATHPYAS